MTKLLSAVVALAFFAIPANAGSINDLFDNMPQPVQAGQEKTTIFDILRGHRDNNDDDTSSDKTLGGFFSEMQDRYSGTPSTRDDNRGFDEAFGEAFGQYSGSGNSGGVGHSSGGDNGPGGIGGLFN